MRRRQLLETLEARQLLAGPQLIGIQPNEGDLIVDGTVRDTAPRTLTFRFDENQQIDPATFEGIRITRAGNDEAVGTADDVEITPGSISLGDTNQNEVVVRFAESLRDDVYRIEVFGFDDPSREIVGLRNTAGEFLVPRESGQDSEQVDFDLRLGAQIEAVVPQPVVRLDDGSLKQRRNEILVYFNEDELFIENDPATGEPTTRSAEHPRFYQLLRTQETVRTTDDDFFSPERVIYDAESHTARLIFTEDLNHLAEPGDVAPLEGSTFRLRIGTAVDDRQDLIVQPTQFDVIPRATSNLGIAADLRVEFVSKVFGEAAGNRAVRFVDSGAGGLTARLDTDSGAVIYDFGGVSPTLGALQAVTESTPDVDAVMAIEFSRGGIPGAGSGLQLPSELVGAAPIRLAAAGDTLTTATDVGVFGQAGTQLSSLLISESIDPQSFLVQLPGGPDDPGRLTPSGGPDSGLGQAINELFGADTRDGVTEIEYNFRSIFSGGAGSASPAQLNNINEIQKRRIREAISLWSNYVGVQFRETPASGITFAVGTRQGLRPVPDTEIRSIDELNADLRIDPTFEQSALVFSNQVAFGLNYGEDFFRKAMAGVGFLLGLERNDEVTAQTLMALDPDFLEATINPDTFEAPVNPFEPTQTTFQQSINPDIDSQTIDQPIPNALAGPEPAFPGNQDILHGRVLHRPDSLDVDLYRFEVDLQPGRDFGTLTAEAFAERLPDSSLLDATLTLFQDVSASARTDFGLGTAVSVEIESRLPGELGNRSRIEFIRTDRAAGDTEVKVSSIIGEDGQRIANAVEVDLPRLGPNVDEVTLSQVVDALNEDEFASTLFDVSITSGDPDTDLSGSPLDRFAPIRLTGGGTVPLSRNDDYFSNDSFLSARVTNGVYYIGVAASGNDTYDPGSPDSGFGGRTQGDYELLLKFEPQVSKTEVIRDRDSSRTGIPGTPIDGDLDGNPGGDKNFWFQTRPLNRMLRVNSDGTGIVPGQTLTVTGASGVVRRFEFVPVGGSPRPGNQPVFYNQGVGAATSPAALAQALGSAINSVSSQTGVTASVPGGTSNLVLNGERSLSFSTNFVGIEALGRTLFVDKLASVVSDGSLDQPYNNIASTTQASAFGSALPGDIVRIVGNGGQDQNLVTPGDNFSYQIGLPEIGSGVLPDGRHMDVPSGVTVMVDAGAAFKLRSAAVSVGSNNLLSDRSGGALQVLGTPRLVQLSDPAPAGADDPDPGVEVLGGSGNVIFTSTRDRVVDTAAAGNSRSASDGDWGGLIFRRDFDLAEGRPNLEDEGIFLQVVNHADLRYGGGSNIIINSVQQTVNPIQMIDLRPTVTFSDVTDNAGPAMSASPNTFLETRFQEPRFQQAGAFTADYERIGPDIKNNHVIGNSINGLFIRTEDVASGTPREVTVGARFDDVDIVHYIAENILIAGQPGGPIQDGVRPDFGSVNTQTSGGGTLAPGDYAYRMTFVDTAGFESLASQSSGPVSIDPSTGTVQLLNLPIVNEDSDYVSRRLYRRDPGAGEFRLIAQLNRSDATFVDDGSATGGAVLDLERDGIRGRLDGSLVIDPNIVVKFRGARIELDQGAQLLAEGLPGQPVVFTSALDDRFGAGGSFDTNDDGSASNGGADPRRGDWSGIYAGPTANVSMDHAVVAYGGGVSLIEGGQSRGFAALELHQASARVTNSRFEFNDNAMDGSGPAGRNGRLAITPATIFARFTQPIIFGNQFVDNHGAIIDIDLESLNDDFLRDAGRQTGEIERLVGFADNHGPLVRRNTTESTPGEVFGRRQLNGMRVRGGTLTDGSVWDDTDIVHVLYDSVNVGNQVSGGALTLKSRPDESLVVKLLGQGTPNSATAGTGLTATGSTGDISDRIGGTIHVLGLPGAPVVLTSLKDDSVSAGRKIDGSAQNDTNGDGFGTRPSPNDWRSLVFDRLSNDRNVAVDLERELPTAAAPGRNATVNNAQPLGKLASRLTASDDQLRLGLSVDGFLSGPGDIDTYAFTAVAGTQIWADIDRTTFGLDSVIEVIDDAGNVLARSSDSFEEMEDPSLIQVNDPDLLVGALGDRDNPRTDRWASGAYADFGSTNPRDAGLRITLPGSPGTRSDYFIRVRSASVDPADTGGGLTSGAYRLQVRLQEQQEFPGSVVRHADIRYANHGIHVQGLPGSSPLLGEAQENESADPFSPQFAGQNVFPQFGGFGVEDEPRYPTDVYARNDNINGGFAFPTPGFGFPPPLGARPQNLGDLVDSKNGRISVGGSLMDISDIDFYQLDVGRDGSVSDLQRSTTFDIDYADGLDRPDTNLSVFYSPTGNPNRARLVLFGQDSNVLDDLTSPLQTELPGELLERGSRTENDPFIGPVALPEGSYFIAVTESGRVPEELEENPRLRRVPVESGVRIFDDHIEVIGGSTAEPPREGAFIGDTTPGWSVTTDRARDFGHQRSGPTEIQDIEIDSETPQGGADVPGGGQGQAQAEFPGGPRQVSEPVEETDSFDRDIVRDSTPLYGEIEGPYRDDILIVALNDNDLPGTRAEFFAQQGLELTKHFEFIGASVVKTAPGADIEAEIERLSALPEVKYAEPDYLRETSAVPDDPQYPAMWHLDNTGQTGGTPDADIDAPEAWDTFTGSGQAVIAVIDSGVDIDHPDLVSSLWVNPGEVAGDGIDNDGNGYVDDIHGIDPFAGDSDPDDVNGHGTHVAGTTAATGNNGIGVTGVNWNAQIMALRVGNQLLSTAAILESLDYITTMKTQFGINVVVSNNSYGGGPPSQAEFAAIQASINAGIGYVTSAGNNASNNDTFPQFPASYDIEEIISVAATDHNDELSVFSNFGLGSVDLAAPGTDVLSTTIGGGYGLLSGTSMASPHVAGVHALLAGFSPASTVQEIRSAILLGADPLPNLAGTSVTGARLNAAQALALLDVGDENNESIHFNRSEAVGTLTSNPFDLTGYSAGDLPRFYFDYFLEAAEGDDIVVQARSNEQTTPVELDVELADTSSDNIWRQGIASLDQFAGDTGVVIEFVYDTDTSNSTAEGLYLDNFLVGFAERGEMVSGAVFGRADFTNTTGGVPGAYQLEIRPSTEYSQPIAGGVLVERGLLAAAKVIDPLWLSFPSGREIAPYETFSFEVLNEDTGENESLTFQFRPTEPERQDPSRLDPDAVPVPFSEDDPRDALVGASIVGSVIDAIEGVEDYALYAARRSDAELTGTFDTNDRHAEQTTIVAPAGDQLSDGDQFTLGDGSRTVTFEFSATPAVTFGNIRIPYTPADSAATVARKMIEVINSGVVQGNLRLRASTAYGDWDFSNPVDPADPPTDARVALHGPAVGNFAAVSGLDEAPPAGTDLPSAPGGNIVLSAIYHDGVGDPNTQRTQGQVIVENNQITEVQAIGIWSDTGHRGVDPEDDRSPGVVPPPLGNNFLQLPPVGNSPLGAALNLPTRNDAVTGGLAPGMVAQNNIVDRAGFSGIKVDGETRPFVIEWNGDSATYASGDTLLQSRGDILVPDGFIFAIDAGGTRVVFEFEDISGTPTELGGSGEEGGDGFVDGHVPVYYRLGEGADTYNPSGPEPIRDHGYTAHELMMAIYESIQGSILVTNGLVELVRPTLGPSITNPFGPDFHSVDEELVGFRLGGNFLDFINPAIYLEGVTGIYASPSFQKSGFLPQLNFGFSPGLPFSDFDPVSGETGSGPAPMAPIYEAPQPLAKLVNNTIRGADGTEGALLSDGSLSRAVEMPTAEPNDTIGGAVDTKLEVSHRGGYFADAAIGDTDGPLADNEDVDFYKVELSVGDRLIVDVDTADNGPATQIRVFNSAGEQVAAGENGGLPEYLKPGSSVEFPQTDDDNDRDGFVDFTALEKGTYYIGISSAGNEAYEARSLEDRSEGTGGTGDYRIGVEVLAPRSFVMSLDSHPLTPFGAERTSGSILGTKAEGGPAGARSLVGTTFTISQIPDYLIPTRPGDAYANVNADGNRVTFEFTGGVNTIVLPNGNINVPILDADFIDAGGYRVPDIMRAIANAINGYLNNPALPNHEVGNGPDGGNGPIKRVVARALGGSQGDNVGIRNFIRDVGFPFAPAPGGGADFTNGFGHDRRESGGSSSIVPDGTFTDGRGTTELYVLINNAAKIELSPEARAAGLKLGPDNSRDADGNPRETEFASEADQLLTENGILVSSGASAAILNNVVVNTHQSIVKEESSVFGFGGRIDELNPDTSAKKGQVVATGNAIQYDEHRNTQIRSDVSWWIVLGINVINRNPALDGSISTDLRTGPSNIAGGNSDFNFVVRPDGTPGQTPGNFITLTGDDLLQDGAAGDFTPAPGAAIIDSAVDSIAENVELADLKLSVGIPAGEITAPDRDNSGQLRADEPTMAPPGGIGANVFKDRGALDRADFVGPIASLETPLDNDVAGFDSDPAASFVRRTDGVFEEFRILVQDLGDDSDPFSGTGIDDTTVLVSRIDGLRNPGSNLVLFENDSLLEEGVDYTFSYDESRGVITLKPLAGIWRSDRSYRVALNNRDRTVLVAPSGRTLSDGDQVSITDTDGGTIVFEFETGYQLRAPEAITLEVPREGTNAGGIADGDVFRIRDGVNPAVVFEFNRDAVTLPGTVQVPLPPGPTPIDPDDLEAYLEQIAENMRGAIQSVIDDGDLNVDVRVIGHRVVIGSEPGATAETTSSGLTQPARTLALRIPEGGVGVSGVRDGDVFTVSDGERSATFEFDTGDGTSSPAFNVVPVTAGMVPSAVADEIVTAIQNSPLDLEPAASGSLVLINLPTTGAASVPGGLLSVVGVSRTPVDGDLIVLTPTDGSDPVTLEINRTDEPDDDGNPMDDGVAPDHVPLDIDRATTADEFASLIADQLRILAPSILGLDPNAIETVDGGLISVGGEEGLGLELVGGSLELAGQPAVAESSTIGIFGPLLLQLPNVGGAAFTDGSVLVVRDNLGSDVLFEFNEVGTAATVAGAVVVDFNRFDDVNTVANNIVAAVNGAGIGVTAENLGNGTLTFGTIAESRVSTGGVPAQGLPGVPQISVRRGIVDDGELLTVRQGSVSVTYEFESITGGGGVALGNVAVPFQPGSSIGEVATSLAAAINNNPGGLQIGATAELDAAGNPTGNVILDDVPGTEVDVSAAPTLNRSGVPGGAIPVRISPNFSPVEVKQAMLAAINSVNDPSEPTVSNLVAEDRGGATFFVENGQLFDGPVESFFLPAIKDRVGNPLKPNRDDNTTQFTILLPTVGLDFGDAPDGEGREPIVLPDAAGHRRCPARRHPRAHARHPRRRRTERPADARRRRRRPDHFHRIGRGTVRNVGGRRVRVDRTGRRRRPGHAGRRHDHDHARRPHRDARVRHRRHLRRRELRDRPGRPEFGRVDRRGDRDGAAGEPLGGVRHRDGRGPGAGRRRRRGRRVVCQRRESVGLTQQGRDHTGDRHRQRRRRPRRLDRLQRRRRLVRSGRADHRRLEPGRGLQRSRRTGHASVQHYGPRHRAGAPDADDDPGAIPRFTRRRARPQRAVAQRRSRGLRGARRAGIAAADRRGPAEPQLLDSGRRDASGAGRVRGVDAHDQRRRLDRRRGRPGRRQRGGLRRGCRRPLFDHGFRYRGGTARSRQRRDVHVPAGGGLQRRGRVQRAVDRHQAARPGIATGQLHADHGDDQRRGGERSPDRRDDPGRGHGDDRGRPGDHVQRGGADRPVLCPGTRERVGPDAVDPERGQQRRPLHDRTGRLGVNRRGRPVDRLHAAGGLQQRYAGRQFHLFRCRRPGAGPAERGGGDPRGRSHFDHRGQRRTARHRRQLRDRREHAADDPDQRSWRHPPQRRGRTPG